MKVQSLDLGIDRAWRIEVDLDPLPMPRPRVGKHGTYIPVRAKRYIAALRRAFTPIPPMRKDEFCSLRILFFITQPRGRDLDNMLKCVFDALVPLQLTDDNCLLLRRVEARICFVDCDPGLVVHVIYEQEESVT